jgi:uncharacterized membrane protein YkvI
MLLWLQLPFLTIGAIALTLLAFSLARSRVPSLQIMTMVPVIGAFVFAAIMWHAILSGLDGVAIADASHAGLSLPLRP